MISRLVAIVLLCALLVDNASRLLVTAAFNLNRSYIAEYLCENKNNPTLHCDGKCFLAKKLKEADEKEKKTEKEHRKGLEQPAFFAEKTPVVFPSLVADRHWLTDVRSALPSHPFDIFHPPRA